MQALNHHHLYHFWMVVREGGVTRASEKLNVSQPTISGQLRELEEALTAMYQAKASGRQSYRFFERGMNVRGPKAHSPDESLGPALDWEEFARTVPGFGLGAVGALSSAGRMKISEEPLPPE